MSRHHIAPGRQILRGSDAWGGLWRIGEPEKGDLVAIADIKEEMLAHITRKIECFCERHTELVPVEFNRARHVFAYKGKVIHTFKCKILAIFRRHIGFLHQIVYFLNVSNPDKTVN